MARAILICGKICSGKTLYCQQLIIKNNAVLLSCDELDSQIFHHSLGENHDIVISDIQKYLCKKSIDIISTGTNIILDWGFWCKKDRINISQYYLLNRIEYEWHYIDVSDKQWKMNIESRNNAVNSGETADYYLDEGLLKKLN